MNIKKIVKKVKVTAKKIWEDDPEIVTYFVGLGIGVVGGYLIGSGIQQIKDAKQMKEVMDLYDSGLSELAKNFIDSKDLDICPVLLSNKAGNKIAALRIAGYNLDGEEITGVISASKEVYTGFAKDMLELAEMASE